MKSIRRLLRSNPRRSHRSCQQVQFAEKSNQMTSEPQFRVLAFAQIDKERRYQLACHHTATYLIHCAAHTVLGPHAHLDITHFAALKDEEVEQVEDYNKLVTEELVLSAFSNI
ncbi:hypothetical protein BLNAU_6331 [Blattamonas nauphoetae]|uniref:Uncharacterized protein n=1 Tax=Blattamonas nauphoetae TaxID=2049346 RepID=A0ABQ9Y489_9EUKA|nr:hypothetical protein BLNAU_6331 [Blattamonas nauphoetae]